MGCFVLTGGPGGGKTTLMRELHAAGEPWIMLPEAVFKVLTAGLDSTSKRFQCEVVRRQIEEEEVRAVTGRPQLCHRGALDPLAYWLRNGWEEEEFFEAIEMDRQSLLSRYAGVLHLVTSADGAASHYLRWPDAHRPETAAQAIQIDSLCVRAWAGHTRYVRLGNERPGWPAKAAAASDVLHQWVKGGET
jgi:hypothetical protein